MTRLPLRLLFCAAVAATFAVPVAAGAQTLVPRNAMLVIDQHGTPVGMLVPDAQPQPDPMLVQMMAMQQAMIRQMQDGLGPIGIDALSAVHGGKAPAVDGTAPTASNVMISTFSSSSDGCSRTMVWRQGASDAAPKLVVDRVADHCSAPVMQAPEAKQDGAPDRGLPRLQTIVDRHLPASRSFTPF